MAYENYSFVSWSDLTPITSARLGQMSTNIDQVKAAVDAKPFGLRKLRTISSNVSVSSANALIAQELIYLKNEGAGADYRVTTDAGRYYKVTLSFPGITATASGGEDSIYYLAIREGIFGNTIISNLANYKLNSGPGLFVNVATANATPLSGFIAPTSNTNSNVAISTVNNVNLRSEIRFGAGTYTQIIPGDGSSNRSFFVEVGKVQGPSGANRISGYNVVASESPMQFFIEDIGSGL